MTLSQSQTDVDDQDDTSNLFRILVSSDIHLGYAEKDAERGLDSFNSFDELLGIGVERGVDMVTCFDLIYLVHYLASFVQQNSKIGGHSNPFGGSSITYVGSVCHQSRVIWSWGAHSALTS